MDSTNAIMQQLIENLATDLRKNFEEMHRQLVNLDKGLHDIKCARIHGDAAITSIQARLDQEAAIDDLVTETKQVMIATGKSYLKRKMDGPSPLAHQRSSWQSPTASASPPSPQPPISPLFPPLKEPSVIHATITRALDARQQEPAPRTPAAMTPPSTLHQLLDVQQALDITKQEPTLATPLTATLSLPRHRLLSDDTPSCLPVSPAVTKQIQVPPPQQQPATWPPAQRAQAPSTPLTHDSTNNASTTTTTPTDQDTPLNPHI